MTIIPSSSPSDSADDENQPQQPKQPFSAALTRKLLLSAAANSSSSNEGTITLKLSNDAVQLAAELLRVFVAEARHRASIQAECEHESSGNAEKAVAMIEGREEEEEKQTQIQSHHVTKIAAELLMDFT
jgi:hypothetical protein